jgi:hypothetical protein
MIFASSPRARRGSRPAFLYLVSTKQRQWKTCCEAVWGNICLWNLCLESWRHNYQSVIMTITCPWGIHLQWLDSVPLLCTCLHQLQIKTKTLFRKRGKGNTKALAKREFKGLRYNCVIQQSQTLGWWKDTVFPLGHCRLRVSSEAMDYKAWTTSGPPLARFNSIHYKSKESSKDETPVGLQTRSRIQYLRGGGWDGGVKEQWACVTTVNKDIYEAIRMVLKDQQNSRSLNSGIFCNHAMIDCAIQG